MVNGVWDDSYVVLRSPETGADGNRPVGRGDSLLSRIDAVDVMAVENGVTMPNVGRIDRCFVANKSSGRRLFPTRQFLLGTQGIGISVEADREAELHQAQAASACHHQKVLASRPEEPVGAQEATAIIAQMPQAAEDTAAVSQFRLLLRARGGGKQQSMDGGQTTTKAAVRFRDEVQRCNNPMLREEVKQERMSDHRGLLTWLRVK